MPGRHQIRPQQRARVRWLAGGLGLAVAGVATGAAMLAAGPATAAPKPSPNYHPGSDTATFTVTGVLDSNCLVSAGGNEVWIKPGDTLDFTSSLVGINIASVSLNGILGKVAGLNVDATIDGGNAARKKALTVHNANTIPVSALTAGDHTLTWKATGVSLVGGLLSLPLSNGDLQSGASLSWSGTIHVTDSAPSCKVGVSVPKVGVSVGPVKITPVPQVNVNVPAPKLPAPGGGGGDTSTPPAGGTTAPGGGNYTPPPTTVPEQVMGGIGAGRGVRPDSNNRTQLGTDLPNASVAANPGPQPAASSPAKPQTVTKSVRYAANKAPVAQLPVLLAIIAIIALAMVTATYARLYLLRRDVV